LETFDFIYSNPWKGCPMKPGYKQTEVGVIPEEWEVRTIGEMFRLINGCAFKPEDWRTDGVPIIRIQNLNDPNAEFNFSQAPVPERNRVEPGDLLFAWSGTLGSSFGARLWNGPSGVLNQHIFKVHMDERQITLPFALLVFARVEDDIAKQAHGFKASFVHVKKSDLVKVGLPLPPLPEQRAIAEALSDVDGLLVALDRLIAKKRDLKQAAMQQLLTGQTRLPGFDGEWEVKQLGDVVEIVMGQSPSSANYNTAGDGLPLIQGNADINGRKTIKRIFTRQITKRGKCGDILMSVRAPVGEISRAGFDVCLGRGVCAIRFNNDFMYHCLIFMEPTWVKHSKGSTFDSVNSADVKALEISMPIDPTEQTAIAEVLSEMDAELTGLEQRRDKTRALKQGMMQELLTGRTRLV
jgi:type I restriction enzyme S subunit